MFDWLKGSNAHDRIRHYLAKSEDNLVLAKLVEGEHTFNICCHGATQSNPTSLKTFLFHYIDGPKAASGGHMSFSENPGERLSWDGKEHLAGENGTTVFINGHFSTLPKGCRLPVWRDNEGLLWYLTSRSNVLTYVRNKWTRGASTPDTLRGCTFVLHRSKVENPEGHHRWKPMDSRKAAYYGGTWLLNENPVLDPDHYDHISEQSIDAAKNRKVKKKYPEQVQLEVLLKAIGRISQHLNIPQPELAEMNEFIAQCTDVASREKKAAIDNPKVYFTPRS